MLFPELSLLVESIGAVLLVIMIVYAVRLNRRLTALQADKIEFERLIASFNESTSRAEASVAQLRASASEAAEALQANVAKAESLRDDLAFMIDRGDELADRLEAAISAARPDSSARPRVGASPGRAKTGDGGEAKGERKSKSELLKALEGMR